MIDTLKIGLSGFSVARDNGLTVERREVKGVPVSHGLLWNGAGGPVEGVKAYYNAERFNLTVKPARPSFGRGCQGSGCWVSLSVPKFLNGSNVNPVDRGGAEAVIEQLETELKQIGVKTDITRAAVTRVDLFRNVAAAESFGSYHPLFRVLQAKRTQRRDYGTTYTWLNSRREFCVYDKREELRLAGGAVDGLPDNLIRFENRLLSGSAVVAGLELVSVLDLLREYDSLPDYYTREMKSNLFRYNVKAVAVLAESHIEAVLEGFRASGSRFWFEEGLQSLGAERIVDSIGFDGLKAVLKRIRPGDRGGNYRATRKIEGLLFRLTTAGRSRSGATLAGLYSELRSKVLAA